MPLDNTTLPSDLDIIKLCVSTAPFAGTPYGNRLVAISKRLVVKFGIGVKKQETDNQDYARRHVNSAILYIPRIFRFFEVTHPTFTVGYLVMECITGTNLQDVDLACRPEVVERTIEAIQHLRSIPIPQSQGPGPAGGSPAQGYLWSEDGAGYAFKGIQDMENWINERLDVVNEPHVSLHQYVLGMCHMDLVRRNIFLLPNSAICFVDWAFAGFFPRIFEVHVYRELRVQDELWFDQLLERLPSPNEDDERIMSRLGIPAFVDMKYA